MRYFHRTALSLAEVLAEADRYLGARLSPAARTDRARSYASGIGRLTVQVRAEGGHYTLVTVETDQVGESEIDKLAKRFLSVVHAKLEPGHEVRGAY